MLCLAKKLLILLPVSCIHWFWHHADLVVCTLKSSVVVLVKTDEEKKYLYLSSIFSECFLRRRCPRHKVAYGDACAYTFAVVVVVGIAPDSDAL